MATKLCTDNAEKLGVTDATFDGCVNPIAEYLEGSVQQYIGERTLVVRNCLSVYYYYHFVIVIYIYVYIYIYNYITM